MQNTKNQNSSSTMKNSKEKNAGAQKDQHSKMEQKNSGKKESNSTGSKGGTSQKKDDE